MPTTQKIISYFEENPDIFTTCIEELDDYNGCLNDDRYYNMQDLNEFYSGIDPLELLRRAYYGRDDDTYTTDSNGNKTFGKFNPNRDYFYYNGYGNLISSNYKDYSNYLEENTIDTMLENRAYIDTIETDPELAKLFDELEAEKEN